MIDRNKGIARSGSIIALLIIAAVAILFLLPTPKPGPTAIAATVTKTSADKDCLILPAYFSTPAVAAVMPPASLWKGWSYDRSITLSATPVSALMDQPADIRVNGLKPGAPITLRASMQDYKSRTWISQATFVADKDGVVDVSQKAPRYGSYSGVHAMGLIWSMLPQGVPNPHEILFAPAGDAETIQLQALSNGQMIATTTLNRYGQAPGVKAATVSADGLVGELYTPTTPGPHPAVLVLGGSEGGLHPQVEEAALLASHGYAALGLAYFQGFGGNNPALASLPKQLVNIPLEYFAKAADFLKRQPGIEADHMAILGWSKGAEAALLVAATYPNDFHAAIGYMPSSVVWSGIQYGPGPAASSWTLGSKPLAWANLVVNPAMFTSGKPLTFLGTYQAGLLNKDSVEKAAIPVERIAGPVLLVSAGNDQIWPSPLMSRQIMQRLASHHHAYADESLCYAGAGHAILPPYRPTNASIVAFPGGSFAFGGNPSAYAFADRDAWNKVLAFLHKSLH
ncbi:MAG: acyl-CoA thioesterase/bile acid-CoA:amino acid N-acyltransferase family protein [Gammaproteobacteria bacterium]